MSSSAQPLTKIQAIERLVDSAIRLLFRYEDPLTIQLVIGSAYRTLRDLSDKKGDVEIRQTEIEFIDPGTEKEYYATLAEVANFLKHADRDPEAVLADFDEKRNDVDITSCIFYLIALGASLSTERLAFPQWCSIVYPHFFRDSAPFARVASYDRFTNLAEASRGQQLAAGEEILSDLRSVIRGRA